MAYSTPTTWSTGNVVGASGLNVYTSDIVWLAENVASGKPMTFAYRSANQTVGNSSFSAIGFDQHEDNAGAHSTSVNNSRFTAPVAGRYRLSAQLRWAANSSGHRAVAIAANGTAVPVSGQGSLAFGIFDLDNCCTSVVRLAAGDYLEVFGTQTSGGNLDVLGHSAGYGGSWAYFEWLCT